MINDKNLTFTIIVETRILGLMNPRGNAALYDGLSHLDGLTEYQNLKVCCSVSQNVVFMK